MSRIIAAYGGGFKPPTKGHLEVVKKALSSHPEIDEFIIYVGSKERDGISQTESLLIWDIFKKYLPTKVKIEPSSSPIGDIIRLGKNNPDDKIYFVIGGREGRQDDLEDIVNRTKNIEQTYPNMEVKVQITPNAGMSGTNARRAAKMPSEEFYEYLPSELTDGEREKIYNIVKPIIKESKDPKKGTGKKPKGSGRRLYTDEDPTDTVKVKFRTKEDIVDTFNKKTFKSKPHERQSQIINLVHQRVRAAFQNAKDPETKKRLKRALEYAEKKKEASKEKTKRLRQKEGMLGLGRGNVGARYRAIEKRGDKYYYIQDDPLGQGIRQEFGPYKTKEQAKRKMDTFPPAQSYRDITEVGDALPENKPHLPLEERLQYYKNYYTNVSPSTFDIEVLNETIIIKNLDKPYPADFNDTKDTRQVPVSENIDPKAQAKHKGKAAPYGSAYKLVTEIGIELSNYSGQILPGDVVYAPKNFPLKGNNKLKKGIILKVIKNEREGVNRYKLTLQDSNGNKYSVRNFEMDGEYKGKELPQWSLVRKSTKNLSELVRKIGDYYHVMKRVRLKGKTSKGKRGKGKRRFKRNPSGSYKYKTLKKYKREKDAKDLQKAIDIGYFGENLNENATYPNIDIKKYIDKFNSYALDKGENIKPLPKVKFINGNEENAEEFLGKTAYYEPAIQTITLFTQGRHPKDIVRSYAHEMIHHRQNLENKLGKIETTNTNEDDHLKKIEKEAYTDGNMLFRNWTDSLNEDISIDLIQQFRQEAGSKQCNIYDKRDNCGPAALDFISWAESKGIKGLKRINGYFKADIPVSSKRDFTREMKQQFLNDGGNWNSNKDRFEWISNSQYAEQWKYIPHYWVEDSNGKIYDPVGQQQFIDAGYSKDLNPDRYTLTDSLSEGKKDPFGINAYALELARGLEEELEKKEYKIFCDMDGVLCDFEKRFKEFSKGLSPKEYENKYGKEEFWNLIDEKIGVRFWVGIPWMPEGKKLWNYIKKYNPTLLSAPSRNNESRLGKRLWVKNNIPGTKLILSSAKNKPNYVESNHILIDDRESTIDAWKSKGGIGILFKSTDQVIRELKELGL